MLYVKYCLAMLSDTNEEAWQHLAECVAQQLHKPKNKNRIYFLQEIITLVDMGLKSQINDILVEMLELGQVESVRMMLERGASLTDLKLGKTAFDLARPRYKDNMIGTPMLNFLVNNVKGKLNIHLCVRVKTLCMYSHYIHFLLSKS